MPRWENGFQTNEEIQAFKRDAVIREAARIISRQGFHNTSLDEVAKVPGISKGTLYNFFEDKREILFECHMISLDLGEHAARFANNVGGSGVDRLRLLLKCYILWMYGQAGVGGLTFDVNALRPEDRAIVIPRRDAATLIGLLTESIADGTAHPSDAKVAVYAIMSAVNGISAWYSPGGRMSIDDLADQMLDLLTRSLATHPENLAPYPSIPDYPMEITPSGLLGRIRNPEAAPRKPAGKRAPSTLNGKPPAGNQSDAGQRKDRMGPSKPKAVKQA